MGPRCVKLVKESKSFVSIQLTNTFSSTFWNAAKLITFELSFHQLSCGQSVSFVNFQTGPSTRKMEHVFQKWIKIGQVAGFLLLLFVWLFCFCFILSKCFFLGVWNSQNVLANQCASHFTKMFSIKQAYHTEFSLFICQAVCFVKMNIPTELTPIWQCWHEADGCSSYV